VSDPAGIECVTDGGPGCLHAFPRGSTVKLTAAPAAGATFVQWAGDCAGTNPTCSLTMGADHQVRAVFEPSTPAASKTLKLAWQGAGVGRVVSSPAGIDCASG